MVFFGVPPVGVAFYFCQDIFQIDYSERLVIAGFAKIIFQQFKNQFFLLIIQFGEGNTRPFKANSR